MTELHLCGTWRCRLACFFGVHRRADVGRKCDCCGHRHYGHEQERARTSHYPAMTLRRTRTRKPKAPTSRGRVRRLFHWAA